MSYRKLVVWQKSMKWVKMIYVLTQQFPNDERFGLTNQLRRAAVSVPSNIAEGQGRISPKEFLRFLAIANGSRQEAETQPIIASELGYLNEEDSNQLLHKSEEIGRMITSLRQSLHRKLS